MYEVKIEPSGDRAEKCSTIRSAALAARTLAHDAVEHGASYRKLTATVLKNGICVLSGVRPHDVERRLNESITASVIDGG